MIERLILIGLINSTDYVKQIRPIWNAKFIKSEDEQMVSMWCVEYFDEFKQAPVRTIEDIYMDQVRNGLLDKSQKKIIRQMLEELSYEYDETFNLQYALKKTDEYFRERHLELHHQRIKELVDAGEPDEAEKLSTSFKPLAVHVTDDLDLSKAESVKQKLKNAFEELAEPIFRYPEPLGRIMNSQLIHGGFVSIMGSEKRGKSFWLLDMAIRATQNRQKVAFFQAGDMTEFQQLRRIATYMTKLPFDPKYIGESYIPVMDCIRNQMDSCDRQERACDFGPMSEDRKYSEEDLRGNVTLEDLIEAYDIHDADYKPCRNCKWWKQQPIGTVWIKKVKTTHTVTLEEAERKVTEFFVDKKRVLRISTHINSSLSVAKIRSILDGWENEDGFIPDMVVIDYADLLVADRNIEFRHQSNEIWKSLRALSQERNCLLVTATQADAKSYEKNLLTMSNFSEDKRKYGHVTAMYGLNQDKHEREKKLGILRINELVIREGEFTSTATVTVLQDLNHGRPFLGSYL